MRAILLVLSLLTTFALAAEPEVTPQPEPTAPELTDQQVRQAIIQQSIRSYAGNCPCPDNRASNGSRCGRRSAYSRAGGAAPLCYESDVSDEMIVQYRRSRRQ
jgi:hypothetical protein